RHLGGEPEDRHLRHARHRGGDLPRRPDRRHARPAVACDPRRRRAVRPRARGEHPRLRRDGPPQAGDLERAQVGSDGRGMSTPPAAIATADVAAPAGVSRTERRTWRRALNNKWVLRALFYGAIAIAWQGTAMVKGEFFLPTIPATINGFFELFTEGYASSLLNSVQQLVLGFVIALAIAIPLGA